jgi:hypothetical protein
LTRSGNESALLTRIAAMEGVSLCVPMKYWLRFWNWKGRFVSTYWANNADHSCSDGKHFVVRVEEQLTAFAELESATRPCGRAPRDCGAHEIKLDNCRDDGKSLLDFVIRQFQLIFGTAE